MPNWGGAAKGAGTGAGIGGLVGGPVGAGIGAGIGGLVGLFKGGKKKKADEDPETADVASLRENAADQRATGAGLKSQGNDAMAPVLDYFKDILGGDPSAVMDATKGPRGRVIDQYDSARQAASRFGARGGGTNAAIADSYFMQANQLSDITSAAKSDAATQLGQLGGTLTGLGLSADQLASADVNSVIQAVLAREQVGMQKRGQTMALLGDIGSAAGDIISGTLLKGGGE